VVAAASKRPAVMAKLPAFPARSLPLTVSAAAPVKVTKPVLPVKVPLLVQFPPIEWAKELPLKVVEGPIETFPLTVMTWPAAKETDVPVPSVLVRFPAMVMALVGIVLVAEPPLLLRVRLP